MALNKPEWHFIIIGCIASVISGAVQPAFSIIFSKATAVRFLENCFLVVVDKIPFKMMLFSILS